MHWIAGPCVIESADHTLRMAEALAAIAAEMRVQLIFKASFDKANRTSLDSYRGPGLHEGLAILARVREATGLPVLTDIHQPQQAAPASEVVDWLQIPAFLCRQTDLLVAAGQSGRSVHIKKGQFVAPEAMVHAVEKCRQAGATQVWVGERGTAFGHGDLVVDFRGFHVLQQAGIPVVFDATHSAQRPGGLGATSGGDRSVIPTLACAAMAAGAHALFTEVHDRPDQALSDAATQLPLEAVRPLLRQLLRIRQAVAD
jgi:2-dehydro-3-deoxyphosphooctonate aldolase (KDO 8-P synthase)